MLPSPMVGSASMCSSVVEVLCCACCSRSRERHCVNAGTMEPGSVSGVGKLARSWGVILSQNVAELCCE